jgi:hypothetical protein
LIVLLFLERRVLGTPIKEIDKSAVQMAQGLLEGTEETSPSQGYSFLRAGSCAARSL